MVTAALILPTSVLGYWLLRGLQAGEPLSNLWPAALASASVSTFAAVVTATCSVPVAILVVRYPSMLARIAELMSFTGYALPGIVVALALVFFGANYAPPMYQTTGLLLFAYLVLFFPAALGASRSSLLRVTKSLEEAARGLGHNHVNTLFRVTAPLMRPGILAGAIIVFVLTMKELPATLLLGPLGFDTLATQVWSASSEASRRWKCLTCC